MEAKKSSILLSKWTHKLLGAKMNYQLRYFHQRRHFPNLKNPKDMSDKVKLCLSDYIPMSQRCVANIKNFHWSNIAERYQEIYNDII